MASILSTNAQNTCMICLCALLAPASLTEDTEESAVEDDIGGVFPCGHVFHVTCFQEWNQHNSRCPNCNQDADQFCKLFLSAPCMPTAAVEAPKLNKPAESMDSLENDTNKDNKDESTDEEREQRRLLLDLRTATQAGPAETIRKVVSLRSKVRKLKREGRSNQAELDSTRLALDLTQEELQLANEELETQKTKLLRLEDKLTRIQTQHWERHRMLHEELVRKHDNRVQGLEKELTVAKMELALRNRQLKHWAGIGVSTPTTSTSTGSNKAIIRNQPNPAFQHA